MIDEEIPKIKNLESETLKTEDPFAPKEEPVVD